MNPILSIQYLSLQSLDLGESKFFGSFNVTKIKLKMFRFYWAITKL